MASPVATPKSTTVRMCHVVSHQDLDECGGVSTGLLLRWMDICACLSAEKLAKTSCVTLQMDHLILNVPDSFIGGSSAPFWLGCAMIVEASVVQVWGTSTEIVVRVFTDPHMQPIAANRNTQETLLASAFFVFCGMKITDPVSGKSMCPKMPAFTTNTTAEQIARQFADLRRKARLSKQAMVEKAQCVPRCSSTRYPQMMLAPLTFFACTASRFTSRRLLLFRSMASQRVPPCCSTCTSSCHRTQITWATCLEAFTWSTAPDADAMPSCDVFRQTTSLCIYVVYTRLLK
jgi:acyl-CoA hydrolase